MKRDMELVRKILLETEARSWSQSDDPVEVKGYSAEQIAYHIKIMFDAGLIEPRTSQA